MPTQTLCPDVQLRKTLLSFYLRTCSGEELADWIYAMGERPRGTGAEKQQQIRAHTNYLTLPVDEFSTQTEKYLRRYDSQLLAELCVSLGLSTEGTTNGLYRRILREIRYREAWTPRYSATSGAGPTVGDVVHALAWVPFLKRGECENDLFEIFGDELRDVFGEDIVHEEVPVHGSTLRIDFHVGAQPENGVGIEVRIPATIGDIQMALGEVDQYKRRYRENLVLIIVGGFLKPELLRLFQIGLVSKRVSLIVR